MKVESPRELCRSMSALFSRKLSSLRDTRPSGRSESREWNRRIGVASSSRFGRVGARVLGKNQIGSGALGAGPREGAHLRIASMQGTPALEPGQ